MMTTKNYFYLNYDFEDIPKVNYTIALLEYWSSFSP